MRSHLWRDLAILLAFAVAIFLGGYWLIRNIDWNLTERFDLGLSVEQEKKLGDLMKETLWDNFEKLEDPTVDSAMQVITQRLLGVLDSSKYQYEFIVLAKDEINAFTIPGGNIYIFSGLLRESESPEEVAAVLAHEIGHAEKRHVVQKLLKEFSLGALVAILSGGDPGLLMDVLRQVIGTSFDREQESEADDFALELLEKAAIDPKSLALFFDRLNKKDLSYNKNLELIMTHPHNDKRLAKSRGYLTKKDFTPVAIELDWARVKQAVNSAL
jgi:predicted Zn-dependent protease